MLMKTGYPRFLHGGGFLWFNVINYQQGLALKIKAIVATVKKSTSLRLFQFGGLSEYLKESILFDIII